MTYTREQLLAGLRKADAAGDTDAAKAFARRIRDLEQPAVETTPQRSPQELQNAVMRNELGAKEEWDARNAAVIDAQSAKPYSPTEGQRGTDLRVEGFGRSLNSTWQGLKQLTGFANQEEIDRQAEIDAPLMNDTNGQIGNVAGMTSQMLIPGTAAVRGGMLAPKVAALPWLARTGVGIAGASAENAAFTGLQPVVTGETRGGNVGTAALWGAGGKVAQDSVGVLARGGSEIVSKEMQALRDIAARRGINIGVPELTNNPFIQTVSNQLGRLPFGGGPARVAKNKETINRGIAKSIGEDAGLVTPEVYDAASIRLGGNYNKIKADNPLPLSKNLMEELNAIQKDAASKFSGAGKSTKGFINDIIEKSKNGQLTGAQFKSLESELGKMAKSGGESALYLGRMRDALRSNWQASVKQSGNAADIDLLDLTNSQYGALKAIRDGVSDQGISPTALRGLLRKDNAGKERMARGKGGELGILSRIGQKLKEPPNTGTGDRALVNTIASGVGGTLGGAGGYYAGSQGWISPELALLVGGGLLGNRALNSKTASKYFAKGMPKPTQGLLNTVAYPLPYVAPAIASTSAAAEEKKKKKKKKD